MASRMRVRSSKGRSHARDCHRQVVNPQHIQSRRWLPVFLIRYPNKQPLAHQLSLEHDQSSGKNDCFSCGRPASDYSRRASTLQLLLRSVAPAAKAER